MNNPLPEAGKKKAVARNPSRHKVDPRIIIILEQHGAEKMHAHGFLLVNGNAIRNPVNILRRIERQYKNVLKDEYHHGLVDYCNRSGPNNYMIKGKDDKGTLDKVYYQSSYLAKVMGKGSREKGEWLVRGTRISPKILKVSHRARGLYNLGARRPPGHLRGLVTPPDGQEIPGSPLRADE